jgi:hypothetical protein
LNLLGLEADVIRLAPAVLALSPAPKRSMSPKDRAHECGNTAEAEQDIAEGVVHPPPLSRPETEITLLMRAPIG